MGRLIFNSDMGIVGVRGRIANPVAYHAKGTPTGKLIHYGGAYSRKDLRGAANVLCRYPCTLFGMTGSAQQIQNREKFRNAVAGVQQIMADPEQVAIYRERFKAQVKYVSLRGFIMRQIWSTM